MNMKHEAVATFDNYDHDIAEGIEPAERPAWATTSERTPVFSYIDEAGEKVDVTMPKKPNPGLALDFLRKGRTMGAELAISWLIEEAIGAEGYDILVREMSLIPDPENGARIVGDIGQHVQKVVMGGLEAPKG